MPEYCLLALGCLGHFCLVVLVVNIVHGHGWKTHWIEPLTLLGLLAVGLGTVAGLVWLVVQPLESWPLLVRIYLGGCALVGLVGLPIATYKVMGKKLPEGIRGTSRPLEIGPPDPRARDAAPSEWIGTGERAWFLRLPGNQSLHPTFEDWEVRVPGLPDALAGLRILHLTDLHLAPCLTRSYFEAVLEAGSRLPHDLVLLTGDIVEHEDAVDWIAPVLARAQGRLGQFAILGNHDLRFGEARVREALAASSFTDIDGRWVTLEVPGTGHSIALGGTSAPWGPTLDPATRPAADLHVVLSHTPDRFYEIARWNAVDLVLSGHNHGGQVRLPVVGPVLMPSRFSRRFDRGFFRQGRTLMYVSHGLGAKHPIRWNCAPEITRLTLVPQLRSGPSSLVSAHESHLPVTHAASLPPNRESPLPHT